MLELTPLSLVNVRTDPTVTCPDASSMACQATLEVGGTFFAAPAVFCVCTNEVTVGVVCGGLKWSV